MNWPIGLGVCLGVKKTKDYLQEKQASGRRTGIVKGINLMLHEWPFGGEIVLPIKKVRSIFPFRGATAEGINTKSYLVCPNQVYN